MSERTSTVMALGAAVLAGAALMTYAGPLDPPAGPVTPTYKTLSEVEPRIAVNAANTPGDADSVFKISQPGSYYLTRNIAGAAGKHGIEIASAGVSIDLMGFDVLGAPGSLDGVTVTAAAPRGINLSNGHVRGWGQDGVDLLTGNASGSGVTNVQASDNGGAGLAAGSTTVLRSCTASGNISAGIITGPTCTLRDCSASFNAVGINAGAGSAVSNCTAANNTGTGIKTGASCVVSGCSAFSNGGDGISVDMGCEVAGNASHRNTLNGIFALFGSTVRDNTCRQNGNGAGSGAGILINGTSSRVEGNTCTFADRGIEVPFPTNFIARNVCANNNTNWSIGSGNICLVVIAAQGPAINGSAGGAAPGSTDPNANFTY